MYRFKYLSIDPGTNSLGTAINAVTDAGEWVILDVHTFNIGTMIQHMCDPDEVNRIGLRFFRAKVVSDTIHKLAEAWDVDIAVSESPYMGRFPTAFAALTECLMAIREGCYRYDRRMQFSTIDPATIKKCVGVKGNSGDKNKMTEAISKLPGLTIDATKLDEHSVDAIAVGRSFFELGFITK